MNPQSDTNKCIVLDIDSTLVYSDEDTKNYDQLIVESKKTGANLKSRTYFVNLIDIGEEPGTGKLSNLWGIIRPHYFEFALFAASYFDKIAIWSAGHYRYVHSMCDILFPDLFLQPEIILTRDDCAIDDDKSYYKPLSKIFDAKLGFTPENTFVVDDRSDTFSRNSQNGILIPAYTPDLNLTGVLNDDAALQQLICWLSLDSVSKSSDVRKIDKSSIFNTSIDTYKSLLEKEGHKSPLITDDFEMYQESIGYDPYLNVSMPAITTISM